jgi:hypothetical protein
MVLIKSLSMKIITFSILILFSLFIISSCFDTEDDGYFEIHITINGSSEKSYLQEWAPGDLGEVIISWTSSDLNAGYEPNPSTIMAKEEAVVPEANGQFSYELVESIPENGWIMVYARDPVIPLQDSKVFR